MGTVRGTWSFSLSQCHINFLELMAAYLVLRELSPPKGTHIQLVMDNSSAVACVRRGGSRSIILNRMMLTLTPLRLNRSWHLTAQHLAGARNVVADSLSRDSVQMTEWSLDLPSFGFV